MFLALTKTTRALSALKGVPCIELFRICEDGSVLLWQNKQLGALFLFIYFFAKNKTLMSSMLHDQ